MGARTTEIGLLERDAHLEAIDDALQRAIDGAGMLLLFEGRAGRGKTAVLRAAADAARRGDLIVASARADDTRKTVPFAPILDALGPLVEDDAETMTGGAKRVEALFEGSSASREASATSLSEAFFHLIADLCDRHPLALLFDDAHWADAQTLEFLGYLSPRLAELSCAVIVSYRPYEPPSPQLAELRASPHCSLLRLDRFSPDATARYVRSIFGDADDQFCAACFEVTKGNAFYVRELLRQLQDEDVRPVAEEAERVTAPTKGVASVAHSVRRRLASLGGDADELAHALAVLETASDLSIVAAVSGLTLERVFEESARLIVTSIFSPDETLSFIHPIVRTALYQSIPQQERTQMHRRAAEALAEIHGSIEEAASHLLRTEPRADLWAIETLREGARRAMSKGRRGAAAQYLERARAEGPTDDTAEILVELGYAEPDAQRAIPYLQESVELIPEADRRASVLLKLGELLTVIGERARAAEVLRRGIEELGEKHSDLAKELRAAFVSAARLEASLVEDAEAMLESVVAEKTEPSGRAERELLALVAFEKTMRAEDRDRALALARRVTSDRRLIAEEGPESATFSLLTGVFVFSDAIEEDLDLCDKGIEEARRRGSPTAFATASYCRSWPNYWKGRIDDAISDAEQALEMLRYGWRLHATGAYCVMAHALIDQARLADADELIARHESEGVESVEFVQLLATRGRLRLEQGRLREGLDDLSITGQSATAAGVVNTTALPWRARAALAAFGLGDAKRAHELVDESLELSERWGAPRGIGTTLHAAAMLEGGPRKLELLRQAVHVLEGSPALIVRMRVAIDLGEELARQGYVQDARGWLRDALQFGERSGAVAIADRAFRSLVAAGGRPRRVSATGLAALTPSEQRVAEMAARGLTNRQIAEALFVTPKAIERHLSSIYKKLGINSRGGLESFVRQKQA